MKKTNPISIKEIEIISSNLRNHFNIQEDSFFPILDIIQYLEDIDLLTIQIMDDDDEMFQCNDVAFYNAIDNFIYIKESVLEDYDNSDYRSNFTLAHELFHFLQYKILNFNVTEVEKCETYCDPEWQANEFAGQLLIPTKYIDLEVEEIMKKFHVTEHCALTRKLKSIKRKKVPTTGHK